MARAELRHLSDGMKTGLSLPQRFHLIGSMACHHPDIAGLQTLGGVHDMLQQSLATDSVQNFGHTALHAGAFASCHDDHIQF